MMRNVLVKYKLGLSLLLLWLFGNSASGQTITWEPLPPMPEPVCGHTLEAGRQGNQTFVYAFGGVDSSKSCVGVHGKVFRFDTFLKQWDEIDPIPDSLGGKSAAVATRIRNKIYITGGFHLDEDCTETLSTANHIFDPETNSWLANGKPLPIPLKHHTQALWRDSLLFVLGGWSDAGPVNTVQVFDPVKNEWKNGTAVPANTGGAGFGASAVILEDTLYLCGGAGNWNGSHFPLIPVIRKGHINPENPWEINWTSLSEPELEGYKMSALKADNWILWLGGNQAPYDFEGSTLDGNGNVLPSSRILAFQPASGLFNTYDGYFPPILDNGGAVRLSSNRFLLAGGFNNQLLVADSAFLITLEQLVGLSSQASQHDEIQLWPNPGTDYIHIRAPYTMSKGLYEVFDLTGKRLLKGVFSGNDIIDVRMLKSGMHLIRLSIGNRQTVTKKWIKNE